jgi:cytochrome c556
MAYTSKMMENYNVAAIFTIENSQLIDEIRIELVNRGYDVIRMQEGADLHGDFASSIQAQISARQEQYSKTMRAMTAYNIAVNVYQGLVNLFRVTLENERDIMLELGLIGKREQSTSGFITQSTHFYNTLLNKDKIYNRIAKFQITKEMLQADLQLVKDFEQANKEQEAAKGAFGEKTELRDKAYRKLRHWMREFERVNKIVFYDKPYLLERLRFKALTDISRKEKPTTTPTDGQPPTQTTTPPTTQVPSNPESVTANNHES